MDLKGKRILLLGGAGMVGMAIARLCLKENPEAIIITALKEFELKDVESELKKYYPESSTRIIKEWGNIFVRTEFKDLAMREIVESHEYRMKQIHDIMSELSPEILKDNYLYQLIKKYNPHLVIDCVNTATAIAYMDVYSTSRDLLDSLKSNDIGRIKEMAEKTLCIQYMPLLVRHIQILYEALRSSGTELYVKVGTSGTGGMGLNIPYTHSEEKPSRLLLSKSSIAGAQTLLLFLLGRTPDASKVKEFKPTAAIAWREIGHGPIPAHNPIKLYDCLPEKAVDLSQGLNLKKESNCQPLKDQDGRELVLENVFINTGENGLFSRAEFEAITMIGQMEFITPEEIAEAVIYEVKGGNTGRDIVNALDSASMGPTYRAGAMRWKAIKQMKQLEKKYNKESIAFEMLGPPRLAKLLFEAYLLKKICRTMQKVVETNLQELVKNLEALIKANPRLRAEILSLGIPILLPDGKHLIKGKKILIPQSEKEIPQSLDKQIIDYWSRRGWVDLRPENISLWQKRMQIILEEVAKIPPDETSSLYEHDSHFWFDTEEIEPGKIVGWIFRKEEEGERWKR